MHVHVCVYAGHKYIYYTHMYVCVYMYECTYVCLHVCMCMHICVSMYTFRYVCRQTYRSLYIGRDVHTNITHMHAYMHVYWSKLSRFSLEQTLVVVVDKLHPLLWTSSGLMENWKTALYMGSKSFYEHAQNLLGGVKGEVGNLGSSRTVSTDAQAASTCPQTALTFRVLLSPGFPS